MRCGTVVYFAEERGYGFVRPDGGGRDIFIHVSVLPKQEGRHNTGTQVFVHFSDIDQEGFTELNRGDSVEFELQATERGPKAVNVRRLDG
jgi:CspA family cold shock protein